MLTVSEARAWRYINTQFTPQFYLDAFRSNFANKEALFALESESLQNRKLLHHFIWLLETETLDKISIQEHGGFLDGSGWGVVAQYRRFFVEEFSPTLTHRQCLDLVERYITCSLWSAYRHWRENPDSPDSICLFNNWKGAKPVLIQATIQFLETQAAEKWAKMKDIRDRFLVRWKFAQKKLQDATLPATIKEVFNCSQKTWKCALKAVAKDIRYDRIPSTSGSAAALVLAWSVDSRRNSDVYSTAVSTEFYAALNQWVALGNGGTDGFVSLCWPEWTKYSTANHPPTLQDSTAFSELFPSIACSPVSVDGSQVTRWILADCMDEEDMDLFASEICVEAAAVAATLGNSDYPSDSSSVTNTRHDPISSHPGQSERGELQHEIDPGVDPESVLVHGIIIVGIIVTFLLGMFHCFSCFGRKKAN